MRVWPLALLAVAVLSGCLDPGGVVCACQPSWPDPWAYSTVHSFFLKPGLGLSEEGPASEEPQRVASSDFWVRYETGRPQPTFRSEAQNESFLVENATVRFWFTTDAVVPNTGTFAEWDAWFGTNVSIGAVVAMDGPDVVQRGQIYHLEAEIGLPPGGLVVESGEELALLLRPVMLQNDANDLYLLVDSMDTPSALELTVRARDPAFASDDLVPITSTFSGTLPAPAYVEASLDREPSSLTTGRHSFNVPASAAKVEVALTGSVLLGGKDLDLLVFDGNGTQAAQSVTPYANEHARLHGENLAKLEPGTWFAQVNNWLGAGATYTMVVTVWVAEDQVAEATGSGP